MHQIINNVLFYGAWYFVIAGICTLIYCAFLSVNTRYPDDDLRDEMEGVIATLALLQDTTLLDDIDTGRAEPIEQRKQPLQW